LSWTGLKKNLNSSVDERRRLIEPEYPQIPISRQCELLGLSRSGYYYNPKGESAYNEQLMRLIDEEYTRHPFYGCRRLSAWLKRQGHHVNPKRVRRLMRLMGLEAIYQKPNLSKPAPGHKKYPYLLRNLVINRPNQVWSSDITYIRMKHGFIYLVAIMDWHSRYVLSHEISTSMDTDFCLEALEKALKTATPEIFNTDQGSQFTSIEFTGRLEKQGIRISMDGRGRALDNVFIERLWRSVKYEEVYLHSYESIKEAQQGIKNYLEFYNDDRLHQALDYQAPKEIHYLTPFINSELIYSS
jgi:putative transposase